MGEEQRQGLIPGLPDDIAMDCLIKIPHRYHSNLRSVCRDWRQLVSSSSFYHHRKMAGSAETLVCIVQSLPVEKPEANQETESASSGKDKISADVPTYGLTLYNPAAGTWHRHPATSSFPLFAQCVAVADKLVVLGGWDPSTLDSVSDVHVIDIVTGARRSGKSMSVARSFFACAAVGPFVYVAGGHDNQKNALRTAEFYDPVADEWQSLPPMAEERDECHGVAVGGKFLVVSGYDTDNQGRFGRGGESFDPATGEWAKEDDSLWGDGEFPEADSPRPVCFMHPSNDNVKEEERLWHLECNRGSKGVKEYDGKLRRWTTVAEIPENLMSSSCVTVISGGSEGAGEVFVMGSDREKNQRAWAMDARSNKWCQIDIPTGFSSFAYSAAAFRL